MSRMVEELTKAYFIRIDGGLLIRIGAGFEGLRQSADIVRGAEAEGLACELRAISYEL
jgi:hypothetical protein